MCGRYALYGPVSRKNRSAIEFLDGEIEFGPRYNAAPSQDLPVFRVSSRQGRGLVLMRWGLIPSWARDRSIGARMINARAETVAEKPAFRVAFRHRRCLVPMSGFYEWKKEAGRKVPYFIHLLNTDAFAAAGLYEFWAGKDGEGPIESYTIITTEANEMIRPLYERMPVILPPDDYEAWLDPDNNEVEGLKARLKPYPAEEMRAYPISSRVNNVNNDGPEIIEPVAA